MKIIKPQSLGVLHKPYTHLGQHRLSVAVLGFFRLGAPNERFLAESTQWPHVVASLPAGQPLDEVMPRQGAEVLLLGSAHAPGKQAATGVDVLLRVDDAAGQPAIGKCLTVCGEREWRIGALGGRRVGRPKPFLAMPITYARAFGGPRNPVNPAGCGSRESWFGKSRGPMPNVAYAAGTADAGWRAGVPAGFGPIPLANRARRDKLGSYGRGWRRHDAPGFARDLDWSVFNMAPADQWLKAPLRGGERYLLRNLHPRHAELTGTLPELAVRAFVTKFGETPEAMREVPLAMDTVWFVPDHDLGIVIHHGTIGIDDSDALDVGTLMVGYEYRDSPKSVGHYRDVMQLRLDPEAGRMHVFNDSQLAPERSAADQARRAAEQERAEQAVLARSQRRLDLLDAQHWARRGTPPPAGHQVARARLPALGIMTSQTVAEGDFDLTEVMTRAKALVAEAEQRGKEALARLPARTPAPADAAKQLADALERAALPAYDLLPPGETGRDPQVEAMLAKLPVPPADADPKQQARHARSRAAIVKIPSLRRQARRSAPKVTVAALPYPPETARALGERVRQWHAAGVPLAGRDLAGADLAGVDFSGADLRETMFDGADLSDAKFIGANLQGAVLVGARLDRADFSGADLTRANLCASSGRAISFEGAQLAHAQALDAQWPRANLRRTRLRRLLGLRLACPGAVFDGADASKATLFDIEAGDSRWEDATLEKTVFMRARLQRASFARATLTKAVFNLSDLQASRWDRARLDSVQAGGKTNWRDAALTGATARNCGFHGADLSHVDMEAARFLRCDFGQADLRAARLVASLFSRCGFHASQLRMTEAARAEFFQCQCRKADFTGARLGDAAFVQCERTGSIPPEGIANGSPA
ncbi:DUF2169 family type VI secretion system accessory protein [Burkholderia plantarii]|uniref:DUF2169 family type VI secretion system accessory protein n=1 Tax=Burkholderia plantarii TaxID=41899 RepID=UPI0006D8BC98|nr:DUF2169 domain-containing protein [Burkholderia plantarii]ALK34245.1 pentapeptide repeat-containing protein [Burkholderia plantarii]GLZ20624.1 hypothetical protein Bpla01_41530 [Burkholderia plantarii]